MTFIGAGVGMNMQLSLFGQRDTDACRERKQVMWNTQQDNVGAFIPRAALERSCAICQMCPGVNA